MKFLDKQIMHFEKYKHTIKEQSEYLLNNLAIENYIGAVELIMCSESNGGRLHITGIGKPAHLGGYIASLITSTGTPCYELHGTEAVHGSSGQVIPGDVVIAISNSGETAELKATVTALKRNNAKIIAVSGNENSWLAINSDFHLLAKVIGEEGDTLNRAPNASIISEMIVLQGLAVLLQSIKEVTPQQYVMWHPGGTLGKIRDDEK